MLRTLAHAFAAGALDIAEHERRVEALLRAPTEAEASRLVDDLPAIPGPSPQVSRRGSGHGEAASPDPSWKPTSERFRDPRSGRVMRVYVDAGGARHYVPDG